MAFQWPDKLDGSEKGASVIRARESKSSPVGVVGKVLRIFDALHGSSSGLPLKEIARHTQINKSTAYRFLAHLESEGYVFRDGIGCYSIGLKLMRFGSANTYHAVLRNLGRPTLQDLAQSTNETVNLAVLDGREVLYLDVIESSHTFRLASQIGMRRPLHCTALGKAILAYMSEEERHKLLSSLMLARFTPNTLTQLLRLNKDLAKTHHRGYSLDDEEAYLGSRCLGAPIFNEAGKVVAAISVSGPTTRVTRTHLPVFASHLKQAANAISTQLGHSERKERSPRRA
ncbi:MAG TPA: IclR family transcriptional regulator [Terriglobales bacterium]